LAPPSVTWFPFPGPYPASRRFDGGYVLFMARYVTSVRTSLPPAEAFAFIADVTRFAEWDPGVQRAVRVAGDGVSAGTAYEVTINAAGSPVLRYEVKEYEAPRRLFMVARTPFLTSEDEIRVEPTQGGSIVTYDATLKLKGPLGLLDPLLGTVFRRIGDRAAAGLRRALGGDPVAR